MTSYARNSNEYFEPKTYGEQVLRGLGYTGGFNAGGAQTWLNANPNLKSQYDTSVAAKEGGAWAAAQAPKGIRPMTVSSMNDYQKQSLYGMGRPSAPIDPRVGGAYDSAYSAAMETTKPYDVNSYKQFMNPFIDEVINRNADSTRRQFDVDRSANREQFARSGGFGSTAQGTAEAQITEAQNRQIGDFDANLRARGFDTSVNNSMSLYDRENSNAFARASVFGGLGDRFQNFDQYGRNVADTALDRQLFAGDRIQGQNQAELDSYWTERDRATAYPYQQLDYLTGKLQAYPTGSSTTTTTPGNPFISALGGGLAGYGLGQQFGWGSSSTPQKVYSSPIGPQSPVGTYGPQRPYM